MIGIHHHHLLPFFSAAGASGALMLGLVTDVVPSAVGASAPNPGIVAASAAGMVTSPAAFDHWIWVPSGPTNVLVIVPSLSVVSAVG